VIPPCRAERAPKHSPAGNVPASQYPVGRFFAMNRLSCFLGICELKLRRGWYWGRNCRNVNFRLRYR